MAELAFGAQSLASASQTWRNLGAVGLLWLAVFGGLALGLRPEWSAASDLEEATVSCGPTPTRALSHWRGYFWSDTDLGSGPTLARGHYPFGEERQSVLRLVAGGGETCHIVLPARALPPELLLGTGFPSLASNVFEPSVAHEISVEAAGTKLVTRSLPSFATGWQTVAVATGPLAHTSAPLAIEVKLGPGPRRVGIFLDLLAPSRAPWASAWSRLSKPAQRWGTWIVNWGMSLGLVLLLWGALGACGLFRRCGMSMRAQGILFVLALSLFTVCSADRSLQPSGALHFVQQADGFLRGTTAIATHLATGGDYVWVMGRSYAPNPSFVGLLMVPLAGALGFHLNDVVFTLAFAAFNLVLLATLLNRLTSLRLSQLSHRENLAIVLFFGVSSAHLAVSIIGHVWQTAHILSVTAALIALGFSLEPRRALLAGCALGAAFLTRPPVVMHGLLCAAFLGFRVWHRHGLKMGRLVRAWAPLAAGACLGLVFQLGLNLVRFGSLLETGYSYLPYDNTRTYGLFNPRFLRRNLGIMLLDWPSLTSRFPFLRFALRGNSILATSPALLFALLPQRLRFLHWAAGVTVVACLAPALLYAETGWKQFGFRRLLDAMPALCMFIALGRKRLGPLFWVLVALGVLVNLAGVYWIHGPEWSLPSALRQAF